MQSEVTHSELVILLQLWNAGNMQNKLINIPVSFFLQHQKLYQNKAGWFMEAEEMNMCKVSYLHDTPTPLTASNAVI